MHWYVNKYFQNINIDTWAGRMSFGQVDHQSNRSCSMILWFFDKLMTWQVLLHYLIVMYKNITCHCSLFTSSTCISTVFHQLVCTYTWVWLSLIHAASFSSCNWLCSICISRTSSREVGLSFSWFTSQNTCKTDNGLFCTAQAFIC